MKIMIVQRILAQLIDIIVGIAIIVFSYIKILPFLVVAIGSVMLSAIITFIISIFLIFLIQYPFLKNNQTLGKGFFSLEIKSSNISRPLDVSIILQREIFAKMMSCYSLCIPVLFGNLGGHEIATETIIEKNKR